MSVDWTSFEHETDGSDSMDRTSDSTDGIDVTLEASLEELGVEGWSDSEDEPPFERLVFDPEAGPDGEVGVTIEGRLEGVDVDSMVGLVTADQTAEQLVFDARPGDDDEVDVSLEGRSDGRTPLFDDFTGEASVFDRLAFDFQQGGDDEVGVSMHGRIDDASATADGDDSPLQRLVIEPEHD